MQEAAAPGANVLAVCSRRVASAGLRAHPLSHPAASIGGMRYITPAQPAPATPCWHCTAFAGMLYEGSAAACAIPSGPRVRSHPATGCAFYAREPGADDEPGPPAASERVPVR